MNKQYIIYKYTSPSNKIYIGQTKQNLKKRARNGQGYKHCSYFYNAIQKYNWQNFKCEILKENLTLEEANFWEQYFINFYHSNLKNFGYNITNGGNNHVMSEQAKKKISLNMKENNPMKDPNIAQKVAQKRKGQKLSQQAKQNISNGHKKKVLCIQTNIIYESREAAAIAIGRSPSGIGRAINGEQKTCGSFHWRYLDEN